MNFPFSAGVSSISQKPDARYPYYASSATYHLLHGEGKKTLIYCCNDGIWRVLLRMSKLGQAQLFGLGGIEGETFTEDLWSVLCM